MASGATDGGSNPSGPDVTAPEGSNARVGFIHAIRAVEESRSKLLGLLPGKEVFAALEVQESPLERLIRMVMVNREGPDTLPAGSLPTVTPSQGERSEPVGASPAGTQASRESQHIREDPHPPTQQANPLTSGSGSEGCLPCPPKEPPAPPPVPSEERPPHPKPEDGATRVFKGTGWLTCGCDSEGCPVCYPHPS